MGVELVLNLLFYFVQVNKESHCSRDYLNNNLLGKQNGVVMHSACDTELHVCRMKTMKVKCNLYSKGLGCSASHAV